MAMTDWISKLDDFLKLSDREVLNHAGEISHQDAKEKAEAQLDAYRKRLSSLPQPVDEDFSQSFDELKRIEKDAKKKREKWFPKQLLATTTLSELLVAAFKFHQCTIFGENFVDWGI